MTNWDDARIEREAEKIAKKYGSVHYSANEQIIAVIAALVRRVRDERDEQHREWIKTDDHQQSCTEQLLGRYFQGELREGDVKFMLDHLDVYRKPGEMFTRAQLDDAVAAAIRGEKG